MIQARGSSTKISYVEEDSFGVTPANPVMRSIPVNSDKLGVRGNTFTQVKDGTERMFTGAGSGHIDAGGGLALDVELDSIGTLLKHGLGSVVTSGSSAPFTHVITGGSTLPPGLSIEKSFNDVGRFMLFTGCRIDSLTLSFPADGGIISGELDILSRTVTTGSASVASSVIEGPGAPVSYRVDIEDGTTVLTDILGVQLSIKNNLDKDDFVLGTRERRSIPEGLRRVSGRLAVEFKDFDYYARFCGVTTTSLKITAVQGSFSMEILLPRIVLTGTAPVPFAGDAGPLTAMLHFVALKDASEGTDIKITLTNDQSTI